LESRDVLLKNRSSPAPSEETELDKGQTAVQPCFFLNENSYLGFATSHGL
jgi:hypothetical protein